MMTRRAVVALFPGEMIFVPMASATTRYVNVSNATPAAPPIPAQAKFRLRVDRCTLGKGP